MLYRPPPSQPGTYLLVLRVDAVHAIRVDRRGRLTILLKPGYYVYVGSACGAGGLRARITRHLCGKRRRLHWHIDRILSSPYVQPLASLYLSGICSEKEIAESLNRDEACFDALPGVGATDDKNNDSHFFRLLCPSGLLSLAQVLHWLSRYITRFVERDVNVVMQGDACG